MSEFEKIDISVAVERPKPQIRFLVLERFVSEARDKIISLSREEEIDKFISIQTRPSEVQRNPDEWFEFLVTVDWMSVFSIIGVVSSILKIGEFVYKVFKFLKKRRGRKEVKKLKMNCTTSISLAIRHLKSIGAQMMANQIKLVYLSNMLAYYCIAIFASPTVNPKELHVITTHIDGDVSSCNFVAL